MTLRQIETTLYESIDYSVAFMRVASTYEQVEVYAGKATEVAFLLRKLGFIADEELIALYNEIEFERAEALESIRDAYDVRPPY